MKILQRTTPFRFRSSSDANADFSAPIQVASGPLASLLLYSKTLSYSYVHTTHNCIGTFVRNLIMVLVLLYFFQQI